MNQKIENNNFDCIDSLILSEKPQQLKEKLENLIIEVNDEHIIFACKNKKYKSLEILLKYLPFSNNDYYFNIWDYVINNNDIISVQILLKYDFYKREEFSKSPFCYALQQFKSDIIKILFPYMLKNNNVCKFKKRRYIFKLLTNSKRHDCKISYLECLKFISNHVDLHETLFFRQNHRDYDITPLELSIINNDVDSFEVIVEKFPVSLKTLLLYFREIKTDKELQKKFIISSIKKVPSRQITGG